jgi:hypothetical protein
MCLVLVDACGFPRPPDVGDDASAGGGDPVCLGTAPYAICLEVPPSEPLLISDTTVVDTMSSMLCASTKSGGTNYCVIVGTTVTISGRLRGTGRKPLVVLASDSIHVSGQIDVGSHRGTSEFVGAGADREDCAPGVVPGAHAGGAGGSLMGSGGNGGDGSGSGTGGRHGAAITTAAEIRGGCPGQRGNGDAAGEGGHGGGAVYLLAANRIDIDGNVEFHGGINAAGEGGQGAGLGGGVPSGAGGGGSGGTIRLDAPSIACDSLLIANGGGGGGGGTTTIAGTPGSDPSDASQAIGGSNGGFGAGVGGEGSPTEVYGSGQSGGPSTTADGGGGGGGGGAGHITAPPGAIFRMEFTSPPAVTF